MRILSYLVTFLVGSTVSGQSAANRLGYGADEKILIVHADDLGVTHPTNTASFEGLRRGTVSSASIMANTPWVYTSCSPASGVY